MFGSHLQHLNEALFLEMSRPKTSLSYCKYINTYSSLANGLNHHLAIDSDLTDLYLFIYLNYHYMVGKYSYKS